MVQRNKKRRFKSRKHKYSNRVKPGQDMDAYAIRNEILLELGFRDYRAYLRSKLWKSIRERKLAVDPLCFGCNRSGDSAMMQVHHGEYTRTNLTGESQAGLFSICSRCHHWIEVTKSGYKRNPEQATRELYRVKKLHMLRSNTRDMPDASRRESVRLRRIR